MANNKKLLNIVKNKGKVNSNTTTVAPLKVKKEKEVINKLTPEEERDLKAKQRVEELLQDVNLTPESKSSDNLLEIDNNDIDEDKGNEWLAEQVTSLTELNEILQQEAEVAKNDYIKVFSELQNYKKGIGVVDNQSNDELKNGIIHLFNELQGNYINMINPNTGKSDLVIYPLAFMNRLIMFFPFLANERKL